jgi:hypothetical protein
MPRKWSCSACLHSGRGKAKKSRKPKLSTCETTEDDAQNTIDSVVAAICDETNDSLQNGNDNLSFVEEPQLVDKINDKTPQTSSGKKKKRKLEKQSSDVDLVIKINGEKTPSIDDNIQDGKPAKKKKKRKKNKESFSPVSSVQGTPLKNDGDIYDFDVDKEEDSLMGKVCITNVKR